MKKIFVLAACSVMLASTSAYAIDAKYRAKLERSGCTQLSELEGCDINKTKAENAKAGFGAAAPAESQRASTSERAGQAQFDAHAPVKCAEKAGQPMVQCQGAVARDPGGNATVVITRPDGRKRFVFFENGKAVYADMSQADGNMAFSATKQGDIYHVHAGDERYEIVEAFIFGG